MFKHDVKCTMFVVSQTKKIFNTLTAGIRTFIFSPTDLLHKFFALLRLSAVKRPGTSRFMIMVQAERKTFIIQTTGIVWPKNSARMIIK